MRDDEVLTLLLKMSDTFQIPLTKPAVSRITPSTLQQRSEMHGPGPPSQDSRCQLPKILRPRQPCPEVAASIMCNEPAGLVVSRSSADRLSAPSLHVYELRVDEWHRCPHPTKGRDRVESASVWNLKAIARVKGGDWQADDE